MAIEGIEFDEDKNSYSAPGQAFAPQNAAMFSPQALAHYAEPKGMAGWLVKHGIARGPQAAHIIMIGVVALNLFITFLVITYFL